MGSQTKVRAAKQKTLQPVKAGSCKQVTRIASSHLPLAGPWDRAGLVRRAVKCVMEVQVWWNCVTTIHSGGKARRALDIVNVSPERTLAFCAASRLIEKVAACAAITALLAGCVARDRMV